MSLWSEKEDKYLINQIKQGKQLKDLFKDEKLQHHGYYGIAHRIHYWKDLDEEVEKEYLKTRDKHTQRIYKTIHLEVPDTWEFLYLADNHLNSKFENLHILNKVYDVAQERGIKIALNSGDILDGWDVYKGQIFYVDRIGAIPQIKYAIEKYPKREGIDTYFIEGNHDNHIFRGSSVRVGEMLENARKDMKFMGVYRGDIWVRNTLIRLFHAEGGSMETYSSVRRYMSRLNKDNIPDYLLVGHYHCRDEPDIRGVPCLFGKTTQNETPYTVHKGYNVSLGAWIITMQFDKEGKGFIIDKKELVPELL